MSIESTTDEQRDSVAVERFVRHFLMSIEKIQLTEEHGTRLYDVFVHFVHANFGGPKEQRTPTTNSALAIAAHMQDADAEQLCYELCREYLSNRVIEPKKQP